MVDELRIRFPNLPEQLAGLPELAYNLWWSWNPQARMLFKKLDRVAWKESGHNPVRMLKELPQGVLEHAARDAEYLHHYNAVIARYRREIASRSGWFQEDVMDAGEKTIAYFSAEYGLHHSLPFYAGGLGFLAGDHLKECSDLRVPLFAVGFMYPEGYLRQRIRSDGWQENVDEVLVRDAAPILRVLDGTGEQLLVKVPLIEPAVHVALWKVSVGRVSLYLLDTDIDENDPWNRSISAHLYIGDIEQRLRQEIVLGIGGSEALSIMGVAHSVLHLNEGHPAFAILERIRMRVAEGATFEEASAAVRATTVFTTHTPVPAGHDVFPFTLMDKYFSKYYPLLGLSREAFLQLGVHPAEPSAGFNMTAFALRMSTHHNGVSIRHGEVARRMWMSLWPDRKEEDVPISSVTNGVHVPSWIEPKMELLFNRYLGPGWLDDHDSPVIWELVNDIPDEELWKAHFWLKMKLHNFIREQVRKRWVDDRISATNVVAGGTILDPTTLTIGFARRFATYKRADLIFRDLERLRPLLSNRWQPVQIIFSGKAHPADDAGKRILQKIFSFAIDPGMSGRIAFVENYDEQLAQYLIHGVDVWMNNPLPPLEASGTSGMKAAVNGIPHLSIADGWWIEGFTGDNGWSFGLRDGPPGDRDGADADELYGIIEKKIVPLYYDVDENGIPRGWIRFMKKSIINCAPRFSARRMVKEYTTRFYQAALKAV